MDEENKILCFNTRWKTSSHSSEKFLVNYFGYMMRAWKVSTVGDSKHLNQILLLDSQGLLVKNALYVVYIFKPADQITASIPSDKINEAPLFPDWKQRYMDCILQNLFMWRNLRPFKNLMLFTWGIIGALHLKLSISSCNRKLNICLNLAICF